MRLLLLISIFLLGLYPELSAQNKKREAKVESDAQKHWKKGIQERKADNDDAALVSFHKSIGSDSTYYRSYYEIASIHYRRDSFHPAIDFFKKGIQYHNNPDPSVYFTIGQAYWSIDQFELAADWFDQTLRRPGISTALSHKARKFKRDALFTMENRKSVIDTEWQKLSESINSEYPEYLSTLTADGKTLIFTRRIQRQEDFYIAQKNAAGIWEDASSLESLNSQNNEGALCISADGKRIVYTICNDKSGYGACDLYEVIEKDGVWGYPSNLGPHINSAAWDSQPSLSPDGNTLFFVSNRPDGYGDNDIWYSKRTANGKWGKAENAGPIINSDANELTPLLHFDGQTLYFASEGHPGFGGFDLFHSVKQADNNWSKPLNFGFGINSKRDESGLAVSLDGKTAILTRLEEDHSKNVVLADLYALELPEAVRAAPATYCKIFLKDKTTNLPIMGSLELIDLASGLHAGRYRTDETGEALIILEKGAKYAVQSAMTGYLFASLHFDVPTTYNKDDIPATTLYLQALKETVEMNQVREPVVLNNIFFDTGSASLQKMSYPELEKLAEFLKENAGVKIRINGHTDNMGTDAVNQPLSEARAKAVYDYLIRQGIEAGRLSYKGFGASNPVAENTTESGRALNRRTEYEIVE